MRLPSELEVKQEQLAWLMYWLRQTEWPLKLLKRDQVAEEAELMRAEIEALRSKG